MTRSKLEELICSGLSLRAIAAKEGCSVTTVRYWARKHKLRKSVARPRYSYNEDLFRWAVAENQSIAGVLKALKRAIVGSAYKWVKREVARLGLDTSHWKGQAHGRNRPLAIPWEKVLIEVSPYPLGGRRKRGLIRDGHLQNKCSLCGSEPVWMGKPLVLVLDHINGIRNDNRLTNLRLVCPNCNSQLPTFCGRNSKADRPPVPREEEVKPLPLSPGEIRRMAEQAENVEKMNR
jgi:hypothetical protein